MVALNIRQVIGMVVIGLRDRSFMAWVQFTMRVIKSWEIIHMP